MFTKNPNSANFIKLKCGVCRTGGRATRGGGVSLGSAGPGAPELPGTAGRPAVGPGVCCWCWFSSFSSAELTFPRWPELPAAQTVRQPAGEHAADHLSGLPQPQLRYRQSSQTRQHLICLAGRVQYRPEPRGLGSNSRHRRKRGLESYSNSMR